MVFSVHLHGSYMCIQSIQSETFDILGLMKLNTSSFLWGFIEGEWCLHQVDRCWQVVPNQRLLYRASNVEEDECMGLDEELKKQPRAMIAGSGKRKGEATVSPVKKVAKVHDTSISFESFSSPIPTTLNEINTPTSNESLSTSKTYSIGTKPSCSTSTTNLSSPPPAPKKKRQWPHGFSLQEVVTGLTQLRKLRKSGYLQEDAFFKVFGVKCVRETLRLKTKILESAKITHNEIYNAFLEHGNTNAGRWVLFEATVTGKQLRGCNRHLQNLYDDNASGSESSCR